MLPRVPIDVRTLLLWVKPVGRVMVDSVSLLLTSLLISTLGWAFAPTAKVSL